MLKIQNKKIMMLGELNFKNIHDFECLTLEDVNKLDKNNLKYLSDNVELGFTTKIYENLKTQMRIYKTNVLYNDKMIYLITEKNNYFFTYSNILSVVFLDLGDGIRLAPLHGAFSNTIRSLRHEIYKDEDIWDYTEYDYMFSSLILVDDKIAGYLIYSVYDEYDYVFINEILIIEEYRNQHIFTYIIDTFKDIFDEIRLCTNNVDLYKKLGFNNNSDSSKYYHMKWKKEIKLWEKKN